MGGFFQAAQATKRRVWGGNISPSNTYNTAKVKIDGDLQTFLSIPYKIAQAGIGGNL